MTLLIKKVEDISEYLVHNAQLSESDIKLFYEFCYKLLKRYRESANADLITEFLEEDIAKIYLVVHDLMYDNGNIGPLAQR